MDTSAPVEFPPFPALLLFDEVHELAKRNAPDKGGRWDDAFPKHPSLMNVFMKQAGVADCACQLHTLVLLSRFAELVPKFVNTGNIAVVWVALLRLSCAQLVDSSPRLSFFATHFGLYMGQSPHEKVCLRYYERYIFSALDFQTQADYSDCQLALGRLVFRALRIERAPRDWTIVPPSAVRATAKQMECEYFGFLESLGEMGICPAAECSPAEDTEDDDDGE